MEDKHLCPTVILGMYTPVPHRLGIGEDRRVSGWWRPASPLQPTRGHSHACVCGPLRRTRSSKPRRGRDDSVSNQIRSPLALLRDRPRVVITRWTRNPGRTGGRVCSWSWQTPVRMSFTLTLLTDLCSWSNLSWWVMNVSVGCWCCRWVPVGRTNTTWWWWLRCTKIAVF